MSTTEENGKPLERSEGDEGTLALEAAKAAAASISSEKERVKTEVKKAEDRQMEAEKDMSTNDLKALKQLEFYFSDSNFRRDNFLRGKANENEEGFVEIAVLLTFNRLKQLCNDAEKLATLASISAKLIVSEDKKLIRRSNKLPNNDNSKFRTMYASKIPVTETLDSLIELFTNNNTLKVLSLRMRRDRETKAFNGTAFIEYGTEAECKKAVEESQFIVKDETEPLFTQLLTTYLKERSDSAAPRRRDNNNNSRNTNKRVRKDSKPATTFKIEEGTCLFLEGIAPQEVDREGMKELFGKYGSVTYVDFQRGDVSGFVRMETKDGTTKIMEEYAATKDNFQLGGQTFEMRLLAGDEEKAYFEKVEQGRRERRERCNNSKRRRR
jgi:lupus La protein